MLDPFLLVSLHSFYALIEAKSHSLLYEALPSSLRQEGHVYSSPTSHRCFAVRTSGHDLELELCRLIVRSSEPGRRVALLTSINISLLTE